MGGRARAAGKKVNPPDESRSRRRPGQRNSPPVVGKRGRADGGTDFLPDNEPAIAMAGMIIQKRPTSIAIAPVML